MNLSVKELEELKDLLNTLNRLNHIAPSNIDVYDGMGMMVGTLVMDGETWSLEYGENNA